VRSDDPSTWHVECEIAILDAIRARDPILARGAMAEHYAFFHDPVFAQQHARSLSEAFAPQ
jgi:DNA-binding FadR family transcriptional regulator